MSVAKMTRHLTAAIIDYVRGYHAEGESEAETFVTMINKVYAHEDATPEVRFTLDKLAFEPTFGSPQAAGLDLYALHGDVIHPDGQVAIATGVAIELSPGWEGQVRSRSGMAKNSRVSVVNSPGTVDADYRGEITVLLRNEGTEDFFIKRGDRIAQLVVARAPRPHFVKVEKLSASERGKGGFGSTGT